MPERIAEALTAPGSRPGALAGVLEGAAARAAGSDGRMMTLVSLAIEVGAFMHPGESLAVDAWVERATRTLVFAAAEIRRAGDGALVGSGSAVFKVEPSAPFDRSSAPS